MSQQAWERRGCNKWLGRRKTFAFYFPNWRWVDISHSAKQSEARLSKEWRSTFLMIHHLTITMNLEKDVQCLCFTVLRVRVGLMLVFLSLPFSFRSPALCADLWGMSLINDGCGKTHLSGVPMRLGSPCIRRQTEKTNKLHLPIASALSSCCGWPMILCVHLCWDPWVVFGASITNSLPRCP